MVLIENKMATVNGISTEDDELISELTKEELAELNEEFNDPEVSKLALCFYTTV